MGLGLLLHLWPRSGKRECWCRAARPQGFQLLSRQLVYLLLLDCHHKFRDEAGQHVDQGLAVVVHEHPIRANVFGTTTRAYII